MAIVRLARSQFLDAGKTPATATAHRPERTGFYIGYLPATGRPPRISLLMVTRIERAAEKFARLVGRSPRCAELLHRRGVIFALRFDADLCGVDLMKPGVPFAFNPTLCGKGHSGAG